VLYLNSRLQNIALFNSLQKVKNSFLSFDKPFTRNGFKSLFPQILFLVLLNFLLRKVTMSAWALKHRGLQRFLRGLI